MHLASPDGTLLVLADAFGLTRLQRPGKLKTDRALATQLGQPSTDARGTRLLASNGRSFRAELRALPGLEKAAAITVRAGDESRLHPDGEHLVQPRAWPDPTPRLHLHLPDREDPQGQPLASGRDLGELALGPSREPASPPSGLALAPDGSYLALFRDGALFGGRLEGARVVPGWQARLAPGVGRLGLYPGASGSLVVRHSTRAGRAWLARIGPGGEPARQELEAWGPPEPCGADLGYQAAEDAVVRAGRRFPLGAEAGEGELLPCGDGLYFLPWHAEALLDLTGGKALPRKLPPAEHPVRRYLTGLRRTLHAAGRPADARFALDVPRIATGSFPRFGQSFASDGGDGSLLSRLVEGVARLPGEALARGETQPFGLGSWGMSGGGRLLGTAEVADVEACLAACDAHGLWITDLLTALESDYDAAGGYRRRLGSDAPPTGAPLLTPAAGSLLLWAVLETVAQGARFPLSPQAPGWKATPLSPAAAAERVQALAAREWQRPFGLSLLLARALAHHFGPEAGAPLATLLVTHPDGFTRGNAWQVLEVAKRACARHPPLRAALLAACAAAGGGEHVEAVRGTLAA